MAGSVILKLALFASATLAMPFDLQELSHRHYSPGADPPFPHFNPHAGEFPHGSMPCPTGTIASPPSYTAPTGTAYPSGHLKRDHFPKGFHIPPFGTAPSGGFPHPTGFAPHPTGHAPGPTGFVKDKRFAPTGFPAPTGYPVPTGGFHDFEPQFFGHYDSPARRQFDGPRKGGFKPHFPASGPGEYPAPSGTSPSVPTAST